MIIPSIDILDGRAVQLVGGERLAIDAGDPLACAERFALAGELAVIDLNAALGSGSNSAIIERLVRRYPCRVGGGIRSYEAAIRWLDLGARKIILGTAASAKLLARLPRQRVIAALDCRDRDVVIEGWRTRTGESVFSQIERLAAFVSGFLVTTVEREGQMGGCDEELAMRLVDQLSATRPYGPVGDGREQERPSLTLAGGVTSAEEVRRLDALGVNCQVGMALYTDRLPLADAISAPLSPIPLGDKEPVWPTVIVNESGVALGLAWSSQRSLRSAVQERRGIYESRKRGLWRKGETSGATQELLRVDIDCDRDSLRFVVRQAGNGFCHRGEESCWGVSRGIGALESRLRSRVKVAPAGSYTKRLLEEPSLLKAKLVEEAWELGATERQPEVVSEAADLTYFMFTKLAAEGVSFADVEWELDNRALRMTRRGGERKNVNGRDV